MKYLAILALLLMSTNSQADSDFYAGRSSIQLENSTSLGDIEIDGVGVVTLSARKSGNLLVVHARGADGVVIGKAETVVGLEDTPIYISTGAGLKKITIHWSEQ
jgi:hypothetical protein